MTALKFFPLVLAQLIAQSVLVVLILFFVISFVDQRDFNVTERRPHYELVNGTLAQVPSRERYPLQTDITTILSFALTILGKSYAAWIAVMTWNYAFLLLEKNGMRSDTLSSMLSLPIIPGLPLIKEPEVDNTTDPQSPNHEAERIPPIWVALILFSLFPASLSSSLLTGSINWRASFRNVSDADIVKNIGLGVNGDNIDPWWNWCNVDSFRPHYIHRASALATHAWNSVNDSVQNPPSFKRVIPSLQNLPVATSLENVTVPWFKIESFGWITDGSDISSLSWHWTPYCLGVIRCRLLYAPLPFCQTPHTRPPVSGRTPARPTSNRLN
jgi:hypothetical protein